MGNGKKKEIVACTRRNNEQTGGDRKEIHSRQSLTRIVAHKLADSDRDEHILRE